MPWLLGYIQPPGADSASAASPLGLDTKFDQSILRRIIKTVNTRCQISRLNCTNSILAGAPPQTLLRGLQRFPDP